MGNSNIRSSGKQEECFSLTNGALILEQQIVSFNGQSLPMRIYSAEELHNATDGYAEDRFMKEDTLWTLYRGTHGGRAVSVKKFNTSLIGKEKILEKIAVEVAIGSQMGKHSNISKLLGYCAETELPILVYEHIENGHLGLYIYGSGEDLSWYNRLKILNEVANAVSFLHCGTSRVVIQGDIKPFNIFLDKNYSAKLGDFILSKIVPLGEDHVNEDIVTGTYGFIALESIEEGRYTEKSDVYGFGATMFEVLTGRKVVNLYEHGWNFPSKDNNMTASTVFSSDGMGDNIIARSMNEMYSAVCISGGDNEHELKECTELITRCVRAHPDERPTMIQVAQALREIRRLHDHNLDLSVLLEKCFFCRAHLANFCVCSDK